MTENESQDVLDAAVLDELRDLAGPDDPSLLIEVIDLFLEDAPGHINNLQQHVADSDMEGLEHAAHALKSSSAYVGAMILSGLCREIERIGREGAEDGAAARIEELVAHYEDVRVALETVKS